MKRKNIKSLKTERNIKNAPLLFKIFSANQYVGKADKVEINVVKPLNFLEE